MPKRQSTSPDPRAPIRRAFCLLAVLALGACLARAEEPPKAQFVKRPDSELLLLALRLGSQMLADTLPAYPTPGGVLVPLGEVCRLLDLAIEVDVARGSASGFFIAENRRFSLDVPGRRILVEGKERSYPGTGVEVHRDDIYVDTQLLSRWLPIDFAMDLYAAVIIVRPRELLPIQTRAEREAKGAKGLGAPGVPQYPRMETPYHLFDWPEVDQTIRYTLAPKTGGGYGQDVQASTYASADLLGHEAEGYLFVDSNGGVSDSRLTLGRKDPDGELLGFLKAKEYAVGNVLYPGLDLISLAQSGNGFLLSNFPLNRQSQFDRNTFRGPLPPGWDVELYQNESLIAFQTSRSDGLYEFDDIPLLYGLNVFRLVFYGPQGQRREEVQRFNVADSLPPAGQLWYRLVGNNPSAAGERGHFELNYGLLSRLSAAASVAELDLPDGWHKYGQLGLRGYWGPFFAQGDAMADFGKGSLFGGTVQSRLGPVGLLGSFSKLSDFESELFPPLYGPVSSRSELRLDTILPKTLLPPIPILLDSHLDRTTTGLDVWEINGRVSTAYRGFALSNIVDWRTFRGTGALPPSALGDLLVSQVLGTLIVRSEALYNLQPATTLTSLSLTGEKRLGEQYQVSAAVTRIVTAGQIRYDAGISRLEGLFAFGVNLEYTNPGGFGAVLSVNASVVRDPITGKWHMQGRPLAGSGALSALTYLDANGNGQRDPGEQALQGVGFMTSSGGRAEKTGADGTALLVNLPPYQDLDVGVATSTLEDPLAQPSREGVRIVPRPGRVVPVDFPVVILGEVTGTVYRRRGGVTEPTSGVEVQVVNASGAIVRKARSAYDGFFDITGLSPGHYSLRVSPEQMERLGLAPPPSLPIVMEPTGTILDGLDFVIEAPEPKSAP